MKHVFIFSAGRTGTVSLARILGEVIAEPCVVVHEPEPRIQPLVRAFVGGQEFDRAVRAFHDRTEKAKRRLEVGDGAYVEVNPYLAWLAPIIRSAYPEAMRILIVRDFRTWAVSMLSKRVSGRRLGDRLSPDKIKGDPFADSWDRMSVEARAAWHWRRMNEYAISDTPDDVVRYERIFGGSHLMRQFLGGLGLALHPDRSDHEYLSQLMSVRDNATAGESWRSWGKWGDVFRADCLEIAGELMDVFGYAVGEDA